jgi:hypothetical protein
MNTSISELRKYRITLDSPFFNSDNNGIALFDLTTSFLGAFFLDYFFNISSYLSNYTPHYKIVYYLLVIPFGILVHILFNKKTFLNSKLMSSDFNMYKVLVLLIVIITVVTFNS